MSSALAEQSVKLTFHDLLRRFAPDYLERFGADLPQRPREVLQRILRCRTPALGGQLFGCPDCHSFRSLYHSCNDRHCPLCGQTDAQDWLARQQARLLLPVPYFFLTFTRPDFLRTGVRDHPKLGYDLLFAASAQAIQDLAGDPKRLGAQWGLLGVLHTWTRTLIFHPPIHYRIPGGGLSLDGRTWIASGPKFFLHYRPVALRFRTLFAEQLKKQALDLYAQIPKTIWTQRWNLNVEAAGSGENALRYLARYVFKTATGNRRLELLPDGQVRWPFRSSQTRQWTHLDWTPQELIRRFAQHILPQSYCRVRSFGWFHPAAPVRLNRLRALLRLAPVLSMAQKQTGQIPQGLRPVEPQAPPQPPPIPSPLGPGCHKPMIFFQRWQAGQTPPLPQRPRPP